MRVLLVGSSVERARLRARLNGSIEVAGEFASLAAARSSDVDVEASVMAGGGTDTAPGRRDELGGRQDVGRAGRPWPAPDDDDEYSGDEPLTPREVQVLELLAEGLPNKAIAGRLRISDQTVKFHVSSISGKLGAKNRTDAVRRAVRRGLITL
jgi:DNA-binding NarL/FixJ family response regulator